MDYKLYIDQFQKAAKLMNIDALGQQQVEVAVVQALDSVVLKLYKRSWTNDEKYPLDASTRIFFSIWVNEKTIEEKRLYYNIHALKLRGLKGYSIASKKFASSFRLKFEKHAHEWKNVSLNFGPLTLIEGFQKLELENIAKDVADLANKFMGINYLIEQTLVEFERC